MKAVFPALLGCAAAAANAKWVELPAAVICGTQAEIDAAVKRPWIALPSEDSEWLNGERQYYWVRVGRVQLTHETREPCVLVTADSAE